ncbi:hypothetical protein IH781_01440 [Patescibacteria group bacterium]|nr:hypothetical protein [Patescibacteria group bacterium]
MDEMDIAQQSANEAAQQDLIRGKYYRFDPPVSATGFPTGGSNVCEESELEFSRGWYIGFSRDQHIFQGTPINDHRVIPVPKRYENTANTDDIVERLRVCYFHILFIGGSKAILDENQGSN